MIDSQKLQEAQDLVQTCADLTATPAETVESVKAAVATMAASVDAGQPQEHVHTGLLNATVRNVDGRILVRVNYCTRGGRSKFSEAYVN